MDLFSNTDKDARQTLQCGLDPFFKAAFKDLRGEKNKQYFSDKNMETLGMLSIWV